MEKRLRIEKPKALIRSCLIYPCGETDLLIVDGNYISQFEVKRTNHDKAREKANFQLKRGEDYWSNHGQNLVDSYYVFSRGEHFYEVNKVVSFDPMTYFRKRRFYLRGREL